MRHIRLARIAAAATLLAVGLATLPAAADPEAAEAQCTADYTDGQKLRAEGQYMAARQKSLACANDACASWIKADCLKWVAELDAATPTVLLEVHDLAGAETSEVRVTLDGKPWLQRLEGRAVAADPGPHTLVFHLAGAAPIEQRVVLRELEKGRKVAVSFAPAVREAPVVGPQAPPVSVAQPAAPPEAPPPEQEAGGVPAWAWVLSVTGVVAIGVATPLIVVAAGSASDASEICPPPSCAAEPNAEAASLNANATTFGAAGGVVGGLGLIALTVGIYGIVSAPPAREAGVSFRVAPGAVELWGSF